WFSPAYLLPISPSRADLDWMAARNGIGRRSDFLSERLSMSGKLLAWPVVLVIGLGMAGNARAAHCGICSYPCAPACDNLCGMPVVKQRITYQNVVETHTKVCYRQVHQTVMEEQRYTVFKPVYEQC